MHAHVINRQLSHRRDRLALDSREVARKLWHMTPGALILGLPLVRDYRPFAHHLPALIVGFTAVLAALSLVHAKRFVRPGEQTWAVSVWAFAATALLPLLVFPNHVELALTALVILAFGDGAASLGGMALHGPALPWNEQKTFIGTLSFMICSAPCAVWIYWGISSPSVPVRTALFSGIAAAIVAALAESLRSSINDNIRVGAAATTMLVLVHWMIT